MLTGMATSSPTRQAHANAELSAPAYVVLGMVQLGANSGYEIKQAVEQSIRFFWTISQAQIYPSLELLEQRRLVRGRDASRGRRQRRTYAITRAGERALTEWLGRADPMPFELRDIGLVKLFFADALAPEEALKLLAAVRQRSQERAATLRQIAPEAREAEHEGSAFPLLTLEMGVAFHDAMVEVCERFERRFAQAQ
jgi:PadR family transcriptional regulator, regulatory protein AphA